MAEPLPDIDALDISSLRALVLVLLEDQTALRAENATLREEIRRLKGLPGQPDIKPSGMEKKTDGVAKTGQTAKKRRRRGSKKGRVRIDETQILEADVPSGSRFKGYEDYLVQGLVCQPDA